MLALCLKLLTMVNGSAFMPPNEQWLTQSFGIGPG
jgi:hypothetical protein